MLDQFICAHKSELSWLQQKHDWRIDFYSPGAEINTFNCQHSEHHIIFISEDKKKILQQFNLLKTKLAPSDDKYYNTCAEMVKMFALARFCVLRTDMHYKYFNNKSKFDIAQRFQQFMQNNKKVAKLLKNSRVYVKTATDLIHTQRITVYVDVETLFHKPAELATEITYLFKSERVVAKENQKRMLLSLLKQQYNLASCHFTKCSADHFISFARRMLTDRSIKILQHCLPPSLHLTVSMPCSDGYYYCSFTGSIVVDWAATANDLKKHLLKTIVVAANEIDQQQ